jgi:hypothetical protein
MRDRFLFVESEISKENLMIEVADGISKVNMGDFIMKRQKVANADYNGNRRIRNRTYGGVGGRRA